jgi:chemotaxis methyl-accepting protein methylase
MSAAGGTRLRAPVRVAERLVAERTGIELGDGLRERLAACLDGAARARGQTPARFAASLAGDPGAFQEVLDGVTVQETGFFRHPDQFAALAREVLPGLEGPVVAWSAGCANGQEAYSLAMELAASGVPDWQVVATDISATAVARARAGRYSAAELTGLPAAHRRWLRPAGDQWEVDPALRRRVRVERANLTARFPVDPGRCQVVFCRNVLIYLSRTVAESFLDRLAGWLPPGGLVFLGYSEAVLTPSPRLRVQRLGPTYALQVAPAEGSGIPGSASEGPRSEEPRGLWTAGDAQLTGRLRSPTGGPGTGGSGSGAPSREPGTEPPGSGAPGEPGTEPPGSGGPKEAEARPMTAAEMAADGEVAARRGDHAAAVAAFRKAVFLDPDQPGAWFQLGVALGAVRDRRGARRAYAAALAALERCDRRAVQAGLDGWAADELAGVLRAKLGRP